MNWIRRLFHRSRAEKELDAELRYHLDHQIADFVASGMSPDEARRRALQSFGGVERVKEEVREAHWETRIEQLVQDFRYALRALRKSPRFSFGAVLALALGIGGSTVIFSVIYNGLMRPFPYRDAHQLTTFSIHDLQNPDSQEPGHGDRGGFTSAEFLAFQEQNRSFDDLIGFMSKDLILNSGEDTLQVHAALVTPNAFQSLGVPPLLGRAIIADDGKLGRPAVFAMNYKLWQRHFNSDPQIVGKPFEVGGEARTLVAIMPARFQINPEGCDIWIPANPSASDATISLNAAEPMHLWWPLGHVKRDVTQQSQSADLNLIGQRLAKSLANLYPPQFSIILRPYADVVTGRGQNTLYALVAAFAILLLVTCTNVANLLLARASTREKEMAIRLSVGATRGRVARQLLLESFALASVGGLLGSILAYCGINAFLLILPDGMLPAEAAIRLNSVVLVFAMCATMVTALLSGLLPAIRGLRRDLCPLLGGSAKGAGGDATGTRLRAILVVAQIALAMLLLVGTGLMTRTLFALTHVNLGFDPANILVTQLSFSPSVSRTATQNKLFFEQALQRLTSLPGVVSAVTTASLPPYGGPGSDVEVAGRASEQFGVLLDLCSDALPQTIGLRLIRGRFLSAAEIASAERIVVVDETFAHALFANEDPVGQRIRFKVFDLIPDAPHNTYFEIIGVVSSARNRGLRDLPAPQAYVPYTTFGTPAGNILVRTSQAPLLLADTVHQSIRSVDRGTSLSDTMPLETYLRRFDYASPEFALATFGAFAAIGLFLTAVGILGLMAYLVSVQTHEIGVRLALGAPQSSILAMILTTGTQLIVPGIIIGLLASYYLTRFLASQTWGVSATDPVTFAAVSVFVLIVGLAACLAPALRAAKVDPISALRYE
jgi:putative ABC transport system permease protein